MNTIHTRTWIAISVALVVVMFVFFRGFIISMLGGTPPQEVSLALPTTEINPMENQNPALQSVGTQANQAESDQITQSLSRGETYVADVKQGTGKLAESQSKVTVHYSGYLTNGTKFDSSLDRGQPFTFQLGTGQVIPGFDKGVVGMKEGGLRRVIIPPQEGYGNREAGPIPANSVLLFEIELVRVE